MSSRSSSSGFSSILHESFLPTLTLQTVCDIQRADINARAIFCGEQDCRLNELRRMTGAIIDLNIVQDTKHPFERVNWTISHRNTEIRDFVVRRLNYWMQQTQIACDMAYDDAIFLQEKHEKKMKKSQLPPPLSSANFGRRYRTRSLTQSDITSLKSKCDNTPSTPSASSYKCQTPFTGLLGRTLLSTDRNLGSRYTNRKRLFTPSKHIPQTEEILSNRAIENVEMTPIEINQLMETAKCAGVLSDTSEHELNENRVCFADTVSLSKLAEMLRNNELKSTSDICEIDKVIQQSTMNVTNRAQTRQFNGKRYWFHRVILDNHIQFPAGISQDTNEARRLAYRHMIDVCLNNGGVKMKMLTGNRVKVVKGPKLEEKKNLHNTDELDMNATYISVNDLSCLSQCNMVH
ncbi:unnamed protein product [Rotaria sordida]|uniref:Uncharacterized protein n=1 Tax=Rotaria sordida TaxID=392033 RepID=A0A819E8G0_9BILA|nr:unnamed protein product [Rotaria sordida]CAF1243874.1 unnamed protein product [Rotaria sordida]CAF3845808.1 unnamed protein product [Rotaria sordida]CAF3942721.1 unnamed protein product [Rotaria sordida]